MRTTSKNNASEDRLNKITAFFLLLVLSLVIALSGILSLDVSEVSTNGSILCLSCVGIG